MIDIQNTYFHIGTHTMPGELLAQKFLIIEDLPNKRNCYYSWTFDLTESNICLENRDLNHIRQYPSHLVKLDYKNERSLCLF